MFDLDQTISEWRRQMLAAGIETPVPLEELEIHLREDVEQGMRSGLTAQAAFETAVQRMGQADGLKAEFKKAGKTNRYSRINHNAVYVAALFIFLITWQFLNLVPTPGLDSRTLVAYFQTGNGKNLGGGLMGMYTMFTGGGFETCSVGSLAMLPGFLRPWAAALCLFYSLAAVLALCARILHPNTGRRLTRLLNLALLPAFPIGTAIGIYGLASVDRPRIQQHV
jgi:hypothetical protein